MSDLLEDQITDARRAIHSDGYPMSIGELTNMYKAKELIIRPEFQRFFRWSNEQKSRLVESILLGIPLPSIFVAQTADGKWELIDGLQRVSTILQLQGELLAEPGVRADPLKLASTKYLPALGGRLWTHSDAAKSLTEAQRLDIKRSKIDLKIIKRESSTAAKFDLFQRLNNYGAPLTSQETRSALLVAVSADAFAWIERLSRYDSFIECTLLSDRLVDERYDLELVTRFLFLHRRPQKKISLTSLRDLPQLLDDYMIELGSKFPNGSQEQERVFKATFDTIKAGGADRVFRRWDSHNLEFKGSFLNTSFEVFGLGVGYHVANGSPHKTDLLSTVKSFWRRPEMQKGYATGRSTEARLVEFVPLGRKLTATS
ncbi:MAG: DUF262 domain-containing protein [Alphaproteobacteria bacterium]|nr:DUF262 domain-containing protein [Alphaproteobacteria bacterium]